MELHKFGLTSAKRHEASRTSSARKGARISDRREIYQFPYLETARESESFDPKFFEGDDEYSAEDIEIMRKDDVRQCARDLLLVERAKEWLREEGQ